MHEAHPTDIKKKYCYEFPHPKLIVLPVKRGEVPYLGKWALPGGFLKPDETAKQCALRKLKEETDLEVTYIQQFHTFSDPNRDPRERVITIAYYAYFLINQPTLTDTTFGFSDNRCHFSQLPKAFQTAYTLGNPLGSRCFSIPRNQIQYWLSNLITVVHWFIFHHNLTY